MKKILLKRVNRRNFWPFVFCQKVSFFVHWLSLVKFSPKQENLFRYFLFWTFLHISSPIMVRGFIHNQTLVLIRSFNLYDKEWCLANNHCLSFFLQMTIVLSLWTFAFLVQFIEVGSKGSPIWSYLKFTTFQNRNFLIFHQN